jgi:pimeloyl-ACP methyl ester carboxylesterase
MLADRLLYRGAPERLASTRVRVGGVDLHARVSRGAAGPAVVCVHGVAVSSRYMLPTAARLARDHRVLVPDLPGFGLSGRAPRPLGVGELAAALHGFLDVVGLDRASFVANSFGCQIVTALAAAWPERVEALVLVGPTIDRHARSLPRQAGRLLLDALREPPGLNALEVGEYLAFVARGQFPVILAMLADRVEERLPLVRAPALVVRGGRDPIVPQGWAEEFAARLADARLLVLDGVPHAANYAAPDALAAAVRAFLAER